MVGAGAAQASAATAIGFGYFGGAIKMYDAFLAKGSNVELPANTPILLRVNEGLQMSSLDPSLPLVDLANRQER